MRIAMTGNIFPWGKTKAYGGERIVGYLTAALARRGHELVYFGPSQVDVEPGTVEAHVVVPHVSDVGGDPHVGAVAEYEERSGKKFDVFHCNYFGSKWDSTVIDRWNYCELVWCNWCHIKDQLRQPAFNTVSYSHTLQRDMNKEDRSSTMIHYGIPLDAYSPVARHDGYVCWVGKIEQGKGVEWAIDVARAAKRKIVLMGPPYHPGYFREMVLPHVESGDAIWLKGVTDAVKAEVFRHAAAFLSANVNGWCEHLGIVNLEAIASGCPLLAWSRRSCVSAVELDGILVEGVNGRLLSYVDSAQEYQVVVRRGAELLAEMDGMDRMAVRATAETEWSVDLAARRWEWFYEQIQDRRRYASLIVPF